MPLHGDGGELCSAHAKQPVARDVQQLGAGFLFLDGVTGGVAARFQFGKRLARPIRLDGCCADIIEREGFLGIQRCDFRSQTVEIEVLLFGFHLLWLQAVTRTGDFAVECRKFALEAAAFGKALQRRPHPAFAGRKNSRRRFQDLLRGGLFTPAGLDVTCQPGFLRAQALEPRRTVAGALKALRKGFDDASRRFSGDLRAKARAQLPTARFEGLDILPDRCHAMFVFAILPQIGDGLRPQAQRVFRFGHAGVGWQRQRREGFAPRLFKVRPPLVQRCNVLLRLRHLIGGAGQMGLMRAAVGPGLLRCAEGIANARMQIGRRLPCGDRHACARCECHQRDGLLGEFRF